MTVTGHSFVAAHNCYVHEQSPGTVDARKSAPPRARTVPRDRSDSDAGRVPPPVRRLGGRSPAPPATHKASGAQKWADARAPEERARPPTGRHDQGRDSGRIAGLGLGQVAGPQGEPPGDPEMERATPPEPGPAMNPPTDTRQPPGAATRQQPPSSGYPAAASTKAAATWAQASCPRMPMPR